MRRKLDGEKGRKDHHIITSIYLDTDTCENHNQKLFKKYDEIEKLVREAVELVSEARKKLK